MKLTWPILSVASLPMFLVSCAPTHPVPDNTEPGIKKDINNRSLPLRSMYATNGQEELKAMNRSFVFEKDGSKTFVEPYGNELHQMFRYWGPGASNVCLVRGDEIVAAVNATRRVFTGGGPADVPSIPDGERKHDAIWLVAYFGASGSEPPAWVVRSVEQKERTFRVSYVKRVALTKDLNEYFLWAPLGVLGAGIYTLELFDTEQHQVTLLRRVTVSNK